MGMAASQARLLSLTARIHDVEYQAQMIQNAKMQLALQEDEVYRKYTEALDATTLTFQDIKGNRIPASFNNLSGLGSIDNNIAGNGRYVFRDSNDNLIVPSDVLNGYIELFGENNCGDPYKFAMHMMGVDTNVDLYNKTVEKYIKQIDSEYLKGLKTTIDESLKKLAKKSESIQMNKNKDDECYENAFQDLKNAFLMGDIDDIQDGFFDDETFKEVENDVNDLLDKCSEFQYKLFKNGAADIFAANGYDKDDFDKSKFKYYLMWGKLILQEGGVNSTASMKYGEMDYENDSQFLHDMLQCGKISIEKAWIDDKQGKINDSTTSVASDSTLDYTPTQDIDKKAVAKAEAEYEFEMKKIDRKDKQFDTDLNRLETERTALTTEYDSVKKVIQDNVERTFGIFS